MNVKNLENILSFISTYLSKNKLNQLKVDTYCTG